MHMVVSKMLKQLSLVAAFIIGLSASALAQFSPPSGGGGGSSTPCTVTAGSLQYNNSGAFGCVTDWTTGGTSDLTNTQALAANTSGDGLVLTNTTAATSANQRFSPRLHLTGQGWKTTATAASQAVDWIIETQPIQGAANPTGNLEI